MYHITKHVINSFHDDLYGGVWYYDNSCFSNYFLLVNTLKKYFLFLKCIFNFSTLKQFIIIKNLIKKKRKTLSKHKINTLVVIMGTA